MQKCVSAGRDPVQCSKGAESETRRRTEMPLPLLLLPLPLPLRRPRSSSGSSDGRRLGHLLGLRHVVAQDGVRLLDEHVALAVAQDLVLEGPVWGWGSSTGSRVCGGGDGKGEGGERDGEGNGEGGEAEGEGREREDEQGERDRDVPGTGAVAAVAAALFGLLLRRVFEVDQEVAGETV